MGSGQTRFYEPADIAHRGVQAALERGAASGYVNQLAGRVQVSVEDRQQAAATTPADTDAGRHGPVRSTRRRRRGSVASRAALGMLPVLLVTAPFLVVARRRARRHKRCGA